MRHSTFSILVAAFAVMVSAARAQSHGPEEQVLTIGAAEFQTRTEGDGPGEAYIDADGYLYFDTESSFGVGNRMAALSLPDGALIEKVCLYFNDSVEGTLKYVFVSLVAVKLVPGGEDPDWNAIAQVYSTDIGYGDSCSEPLYTLRGTTDVDGDGSLDAAAYYLFASIAPTPPGFFGVIGLGGVQITWKRQVSDPPAAPTFGDVPTSDPAFPYVEALVASGITAGCAGGNYCPEANLTRRQMAVFLAKALGLHWVD